MPALEEFDLDGKTALVTGAGRGIGRGIVIALADAGADIAINSLSEKSTKALTDEVLSRGRKVIGLPGNALNEERINEIVEKTIREFKTIDIAISALGDSIQGSVASVNKSGDPKPFTNEEWLSVIDINLNGAFYFARSVGPHFLENKAGKMIFISSFGGNRGTAGNSAYNAAKAGLNNFTESLALEWAPKIQVNTIAPGFFPDTWPQTLDNYLDDPIFNAAAPLNRAGHPREIGLLSVMLVSKAGNYITGQTIGVDGGLNLGG
jgi:NAD(P)-dependent dehydrogenase (short-subunit alcohol dehydrogenase family)